MKHKCYLLNLILSLPPHKDKRSTWRMLISDTLSDDIADLGSSCADVDTNTDVAGELELESL